MTKNLYIISGCNGAGKTTASFTILPEILNCKEFIMKKHKITPNQKKILKGMDEVYNQLIKFKKKMNSELVILENEKIIRIKP